MQELRELTLIVDRNTIRSLEMMAFPFERDSKLEALYEGIAKGQFESDEEAAAHFYSDGGQQSNYRKLKSNLRNRLINTLFFIDINRPSYNDYQRAYYQICKEWAAIKILLGKNARTAAIELCQRVLKHAIHYEFTDLCLGLFSTLRLHYAAREGNTQKFEEYNRQYKQQFRIFGQESQAEELYQSLVLHYVNNKSAKQEISELACRYYETLKPALNETKTYKLHLYGNLIRLMIYTSVSDHRQTIEICSEAIHFFEAKAFDAHLPLQIFYYQALVSLTQLREFDRGREAAQRCLALIEEGQFNWFKYQEAYLILSMHTRQYQQAYEIYNITVEHKRFGFLPQHVIEIWKIYGAYIHYLIDVGAIRAAPKEKRFNKFRLGRFLNDTPIYAKDKRGMNIAILIIQILFLVQQRKYAAAIDRIEAIEKYCSRYLKDDGTYRSNCFIKMLLQIPLSSFHKSAVIRKAAPFREKLKKAALEVSNQTYEIEIIPFDDLWELALQSLDNKFHRSNYRQSIRR